MNTMLPRVRQLLAQLLIGLATAGLWSALTTPGALAQADVPERYNYQLKPINIAPDTWVLLGATEDFSRANGANIVNIGFIVTEAGVVLIDTGPSLRYAQQLEAAVASVTERPIVAAINTHHHPDHWFGNQHFAHPVSGHAIEVVGKIIALQRHGLDSLLGGVNR